MLDRLELAGFQMSLATRLRALKVLSGPGKDCLNDPAKLKSILCPVIARTPAEQDRFYELFDRYMADLMAPLPEPPPPPIVPWWEKVPKWIWYAIGALLLLPLSAIVYELVKPKPLPPKAFFQHNEKVRIGDTLHIVNLSERMDTTEYEFTWELIKSGEKEEIEKTEKNVFHWHFVAEEKETDTEKRIRLTVQEKSEPDSIHTYESSFRIHCASSPAVLKIEGPSQAQKGEVFKLKAIVGDEDQHHFQWSFGTSDTKLGQEVTHQFDDVGNYQVQLIVSHKESNVICRTIKNYTIKVGTSKAFLSEKVLKKDPLGLSANIITTPTQVLISLLMLGLLMGILYNLWKWFRRKAPLREEKGISDEALKEQFQALDKAPYFIPFRSKNGQIRTERDLFRFADVLRMRQEGLRKYIDVPSTINETIHKGGFPKFKYATRTEPSEYLFLIDQESTHSHQSKLFEYLAELMREKDIYAVVYWYKRSFHRFWNEEHPDGYDLALLHRLYPNHRVFVMGSGHELQDPFPEGKPALRKVEVADFKRWKERFLLSPLPPESWTFREGLLYDLFTIFPATMEGLNESSTYLERVLDQEDIRPSFKNWRAVFLAPPHEPDVNYRKWRRANDHRKYLTEHPALYTWLCALAVHQQPTWELTIAIGKALQPLGVEVTFDHLCLLARIPWLQSGDLHPRLRKELLNELDPKAEALARAAVKKELEVVQDLVGNSHASRALETNLAIQNFALAPEEYNHQKTIRFLLNNGLLNKKQIADLNQNLERFEGKTGHFEKVAAATDKTKIHAYLNDRDATRVPLPKPFVTKHLIRAATYAGLFVLLFFILIPAFILKYNHTKTLHDWVFGQPTKTENIAADLVVNPDSLRSYWFIKETPEINAAKQFNNDAVDAVEEIHNGRGDLDIQDWLQEQKDFDDLLIGRFDEVLNIDPNYFIARKNISHFLYNNGVERYQAFANDSVGSNTLNTAIPYFQKVDSLLTSNWKMEGYEDSLKWDNWHALGLTYFYLGQKEFAQDLLNKITDANAKYFVGLNQIPNLETLMKGSRKDELKYTGFVLDSEKGKGLINVRVRGKGLQSVSSNSRGEYTITLPQGFEGTTVALNFSKNSYEKLITKVDIIEGNILKSVRMKKDNQITSEEEKLWEDILSKEESQTTIQNIHAYEKYLNNFPNGNYVDEAYLAIDLLKEKLDDEDNTDKPFGSNKNAVDWTFSKEEISFFEYDLIFTGKIAPRHYTYGSHKMTQEELPTPTTFKFTQDGQFELIGEVKVSGDQTGIAERNRTLIGYFGTTVPTYINRVVFKQRVKILSFDKPIKGYLKYQAERTSVTIPPTDVNFSFDLAPPQPPPPPFIEEDLDEKIEEEIVFTDPGLEEEEIVPPPLAVPSISLYFGNNSPKGIGTGTLTSYQQAYEDLLSNRKRYLAAAGKSSKNRAAVDDFFAEVESEYQKFQTFLKDIQDRLKYGEPITITLRGSASSLSNYGGKALSARRVASVRLEILNFNNGEFRKYENLITIEEAPIGALEPTGAVSEQLDRQNPFDLTVARKQRLDIIAVKVKKPTNRK